ncbi:MAG: 16S rRNA (cytosine(1402)-N(4))-methyltransferase RsmH [Tepidisphaeraceae bacterium]
MKRTVRHIPVLLDQVLAALRPRAGMTVVDCTLGLGGHASELLRRIQPGGRLIGMDFDAGNIDRARGKLAEVDPAGASFTLHHSNFAGIDNVLAAEGIERVDAILADLGVASPQIDDPARGFSYRKPGPLDMRMDQSRGQPASVLIARMSEKEIAAALLELGDETDAAKIARLIIERRSEAPILTTQDLTAIVCAARDFTPQRAAGAKLHPAARTFQALRMLVNREIGNLERLLAVAPNVLRPGGRIAIISFHSGEDRRVKQSFRDGLRGGIYSEVAHDPATATTDEQAGNPRSRSAKLRWAVRSGFTS